MTNYEKIMAELQSMSIEEFARSRIFYYVGSGFYYGDFGATDEYNTAVKLEIEWLNKQADNKLC